MTRTQVRTILVGDLVGSRTITERGQFGRRIRSVIDQAARKFGGEFYAPPILTRGIDELSAVLKRPHKSYLICRWLNESLSPYQFRFAIVRGTLDVAVASKDARRMDGRAFHVGATMIERAKREDLYYSFSLGFHHVEFDLCLNQLAQLVHVIRALWTDHQRRVVSLYEKYRNQEKAARQLKVTQQAISDALIQAHWKKLRKAETLIESILQADELIKS